MSQQQFKIFAWKEIVVVQMALGNEDEDDDEYDRRKVA